MIVVATSDMHGDLDGLDLSGVDVAFFAGDVAPLRGLDPWDKYQQVKWVREKFVPWCASWPDTKIVFVPGNHDFFSIEGRNRGIKDGRDLSLGFEKAPNLTMLVDQGVELEFPDGRKFSVYGTPWVPIINHMWAFEAYADDLKANFAKIPENLDVLLAHGPPRFNYLDVSLENGAESERFGSIALLDAILAKRPKTCFCGHIHSGSHIGDVIGETRVWNVSRVNESYEIAYDPLELEI